MSGSITGTVIHRRDGQPLVGAGLAMSGEGVEKKESSGPKGTFGFADLPAGPYELVVQMDGFDDGIYGPLVVFEDAPTELKLALEPRQD